MNPPLHLDYFGNSINPMRTSAPAGELLGNYLGWAAWRLQEAVVGHSDEKIRGDFVVVVGVAGGLPDGAGVRYG
ncbi:unnamed protein product [Linum tenue]|uniref:Uncharacterized protein n=1 Tax=Linum tenue TaxID=586396 RepID=A0AAV0HYR7_9ROSI|nr:unnamed protein product [Linum tenue]